MIYWPKISVVSCLSNGTSVHHQPVNSYCHNTSMVYNPDVNKHKWHLAALVSEIANQLCLVNLMYNQSNRALGVGEMINAHASDFLFYVFKINFFGQKSVYFPNVNASSHSSK